MSAPPPEPWSFSDNQCTRTGADLVIPSLSSLRKPAKDAKKPKLGHDRRIRHITNLPRLHVQFLIPAPLNFQRHLRVSLCEAVWGEVSKAAVSHQPSAIRKGSWRGICAGALVFPDG